MQTDLDRLFSATHPYFKYIQRMRDLNITSGCGTAIYCPDSPATRGQMAAFIVRARAQLLPSATPASMSPVYFTDVPAAHPFFGYIEQMRGLGITSGCSPTSYCPDDPNTRGQMAVFIIRGLKTP